MTDHDATASGSDPRTTSDPRMPDHQTPEYQTPEYPAVGSPDEPVSVDPQTAAAGQELGEPDQLTEQWAESSAEALNDRVAAELTDLLAEAELRTVTAHSAPLRMMAVHAHPDDESSKGAATLASYSAAGIGVMVVSCTGGERGDILNPKFDIGDLDIPQLRQNEMAKAAQILGVAHAWLGYEDSGYHEGDPSTWDLPTGSFADLDPRGEIEALVRIVRQFRPQVMTTYDENGGYPHPDHIRCHVVAVGAFEAAGDPDAFPDAGEPWQPLKLYYNVGFSRTKITAINEAVRERTGVGPYDEWIERFRTMDRPDPGERTTTRVPVADYFDHRDRALLAHETQIDPESHWFAVPRDVEAEVWGTEDYELARSLVDTTLPETDLFAGVRDRVAP